MAAAVVLELLSRLLGEAPPFPESVFEVVEEQILVYSGGLGAACRI